MSDKINSWIRAKDFIETSFRITGENVTTKVPVKSAEVIEIVELHDSGVVLKVPKIAGALGHLLLIHIMRKQVPAHITDDLEREFSVTGKIVKAEALDAQTSLIELQFYQFNEIQWKSFVEECAKRQDSVDKIVRQIQE
ncbi:MAG: hypothetical protein A2428_05175 [Bdellovibrionales bacterium RIFOXYC1_FULL_54_43]|nr:MAG: hypothetical protein A2428_05175 [Bdellovibrionales bacterium RIFOXYC1_FULL_54_43]OFZ78971.1 MAG: hypothetical protein A2603_10210 [Bdellovibrionales bacterium RIFOXYD1_FULL_55_31]